MTRILTIIITLSLTVSGCDYLERQTVDKVSYAKACAATLDYQKLEWLHDGKYCELGEPAILESEQLSWLLRSTVVLCDQTYPITYSEKSNHLAEFTLVCTLSDGAFESYIDVFRRINSSNPEGKLKTKLDRALEEYGEDKK